jgi:tetratricopeptide (TPR) repeat protein
MQRYRVNYPLLIGLTVGFVILTPALYFLWRFQVNRNADRLIAKADAAEASGELEGAYDSLKHYVQLRSKEPEAWKRLGNIAEKVAIDESLDMQVRGEAFTLLSNAVRETNDAPLRRKLVDTQTKFGMADVALINIEQLLNDGNTDPKLMAMKAQCLFGTQRQAEGIGWCYQLIGYDQKAREFVPEKALAPDQPVVYALLASFLNDREPELANQVIEQMMAANPESVDAYLMKYQFLKQTKKDDEARVALEKAFELDPDNASVISAKGEEAIVDYQTAFTEAEGDDAEQQREAAKEHLVKAAEFFEDGIKKHPERIDFYERAARIELFRDRPDEAMTIVQDGIAAFPYKTKLNRMGLPAAIGLANIKSEMLLAKKDYAGVEKLAAELRALGIARVNAVADFHEARLDAVNEKWADAARKLRAVRPQLLGFPDLQALAATLQGVAQSQLGQFDLALDSYKQALDINPELMQAKLGYEQMRAMTNQVQPDEEMFALDREIKAMLALPKAQQNWTSLTEQLDAYIDEEAAKRPVPSTWAPSRKALLQGQMLAMRAVDAKDPEEQQALFKQARDEIKKAYSIDPKDPTVQIQAVRLLAQEPDNGPAKALELLDSIVKKGKDSANFRALRVDLLFSIKDDDLPAQLEAATRNMEEFRDGEKALVWSAVATRYEQLGMYSEAQRSLEEAASLAKSSLPLRTSLFELAARQGDDPGMRAAQEKILEIVKSKSDPSYVLTEVKRRLTGYQNKTESKEELAEAGAMLDAAIKQRPGWADLLVAKGQLALVVDGNVDEALKSFEKAFAMGASNVNALALQVRLLADRGRLQEARERMNQIPSTSWSAVLGTAAAEVLAASGDMDEAVAEAKKIAAAKPEDAATQAWLAEIALRAEAFEVAETAMQKAIALNPEDPDAWTRLVSLYLRLKRPNDVEQTLREAFLSLDEEYLPLLTGKYYELQSRWQEAEDIYLSAYAGGLDDPNNVRKLAEFYLQWASAHPDNAGKAAVYLNKILKQTYDGDLEPENPNSIWAKQQAAKLLVQSGDYQHAQKAERLLASAAEITGSREVEDQFIDLLCLRPDPVSRQRAIEALRQYKRTRGSLTPERELQLGDLLFRNGEWAAAKKQMLDTIGRFPNDLRLQTAYASMLIEKGEFDDAAVRITRIEGKPELAAAVAELRLRLASARGDKNELRNRLKAMTPNLSQLTEEQLKVVKQLALTADALGEHEYALTLLKEYSRRAPDATLEIARLNALHGDLDQGMATLQQLAAGNLDDVSRIAIEVLRTRRSESPEKLDEQVSRIVRAALRDDPESARRLVVEAEMLEIQEKYQDAIAAYKKLLQRDDVPTLVRATALNNVAFLLAAQSEDPADLEFALQCVNESIELIGPLADIVDTRALIYLAQRQYDQAAEDMRMASKVNPTASKYYHLAAALLGAGDEPGALAAWEKAKAKKIGPDAVSKAELEALEKFTRQIENLAPAGSTAGVR